MELSSRAKFGVASFALLVGATGCGSSAETAPASAAGGGGSVPTTGPIVAPEGEWTYVPFPDTYCANGTPAGIAVNPSSTSKSVLIFFMGGGACWDYKTCYQEMLSTNIESGYGPNNFLAEKVVLLAGGPFDRTDAKNTFKDYSFVYVPYCTGDVHAGANPDQSYQGMKTMHVGGTNFTKFLPRIHDTFPGADRVMVSGSSAGGFGAGFNFWRVHEAYPNARVYLLDDSGPPLPPPYLSSTLENTWRTAWNLAPNFPPDCADCKKTFNALFDYYGTHYTKSRFALLSYYNDGTISSFFDIDGQQMAMGLDALAKQNIDPYPQAHAFIEAGNKHVLLLFDFATLTQNGVALEDWVTQMNEDDPKWASVHP